MRIPIYIAASSEERDRARRFAAAVADRYEPTFAWWDAIGNKPANAGMARGQRRIAACSCEGGVKRAEVFVALFGPKSFGVGYELGIASERLDCKNILCVSSRNASIFAVYFDEVDTDEEAIAWLMSRLMERA